MMDMVKWNLNKITRDGIQVSPEDLNEGDIIKVFCGDDCHPVMEVNPENGKCTNRIQDFRYSISGSLVPIYLGIKSE